jgi:hypothetical protein
MKLVSFDNTIYDIDNHRDSLRLNNACWAYLGQYFPQICIVLSERLAPNGTKFYLAYHEQPSSVHAHAYFLFDDIVVFSLLHIQYHYPNRR